jgi:hypothetical protein
MMATSRPRTRFAGEEGAALIIALMAMMLLTALAAGVVMVSSTETKIADNYKNSQEALYAADAAAERVVQDLLMIPRWNDILGGTTGAAGTLSAFIDGTAESSKTLPGGGVILLCCGTNSATAQIQSDTDTLNLWGLDNPQWKLFAWGPITALLPGDQIDSSMYVAVWIADDPADDDDNPLQDSNGTVTVHAEAYGPSGTRKVVEITVARTTSTEIERGQIAQRGQEELNQRARKAAVQSPGKKLDSTRMNTATGSLQ